MKAPVKACSRIAATALLSACVFSSQAAGQDTPLTDCVALGSQQEIVRAGGGDRFFLKDGDNYHRVAFRHSCGSISTTSKVEISTAGEVNRLCPQDTKIETDRDICEVGQVQQISADEFAQRKKRAR